VGKMPALLIKNADIITFDPLRPRADSILLKDGIVLQTGTYSEIQRNYEDLDSRTLDLSGKTVLPGFTDAHLHLGALARRKLALDLSDAASRDELLSMLLDRSSDLEADEWIWGVGFNENNWPDGTIPDRNDIDGTGIPNPVFLVRICSHVSIANTAALERSGVRNNTDGILLEKEALPIQVKMWHESVDRDQEEKLLSDTCFELASLGITSAHTCSTPSYGLGENLEIYKSLARRNRLPLRITYYSDQEDPNNIEPADFDNRLHYGGLKVFLDGSLGGKTAALSSHYEGEPNNIGILNHDSLSLEKIIGKAERDSIQIQFHTIGDRALDQLLNAIERTSISPVPSHRVIHLQICRPDQLNKLQELGLTCDIQPAFVPSDLYMAVERLGDRRIKWCYPWKDMILHNLLVTGSSDAPVEKPDPMEGIWAAVNRINWRGDPESVWRPDQCLSLMEAISLYTVNPEIAVNRGNDRGRIKKGFPADLVILNGNIERTPKIQLRDLRPQYTFSGGKLSFGKIDGWPDFA